MDYEKSLKEIRDNLDKAKGLKIKAESQLESLKQRESEILEELEKMGVKPENLENEIVKTKSEIENLIEKANGLIPTDLLK